MAPPVRPTYDGIKKSRQTVQYGMDEVGFIAFGHRDKRFLLSESLEDSLALLIASPFAAIGTRISHDPALSAFEEDEKIVRAMKKVAQLYTDNKNLFPDPDQVVVVYAVFHGDPALPDKRPLIERRIKRMGLRSGTVKYTLSRLERGNTERRLSMALLTHDLTSIWLAN
ncbi:hypothetical protein DV735_g5131, partial [Chaetothyriales sp. CBS 134920]